MGLDDHIWDFLFPQASFYSFSDEATESEWNDWFYGINRHAEQIDPFDDYYH